MSPRNFRPGPRDRSFGGPEVSPDDERARLISRGIIIANRALGGSGFVVREIKRYRSRYVELSRATALRRAETRRRRRMKSRRRIRGRVSYAGV